MSASVATPITFLAMLPNKLNQPRRVRVGAKSFTVCDMDVRCHAAFQFEVHGVEVF